jgi:hypothetical protein
MVCAGSVRTADAHALALRGDPGERQHKPVEETAPSTRPPRSAQRQSTGLAYGSWPAPSSLQSRSRSTLSRNPAKRRSAPVDGYAVIVTTALLTLGVTRTSSYLVAMIGYIAASHLSSVRSGPPIINQHVLPRAQPGKTHAQLCLLDHVAALRDLLDTVIRAAAANVRWVQSRLPRRLTSRGVM